MTEAEITSELMTKLKTIRWAIVLKHSDRFTFAIPDLSVTHEGVTLWFEVKYVRKSFAELKGERNIYLQFGMIKMFSSQKVGWFVVCFGEPIRETLILTSEQLVARMENNTILGPCEDCRLGKDFSGVCDLVRVKGKVNELRGHGARIPPKDGDPNPT